MLKIVAVAEHRCTDLAAVLLTILVSDLDAGARVQSEQHAQRLAFVRRLVKTTQLSCSSVIVGLLYLVRLKQMDESVALPFDALRPGCAEAAVAFVTADKYLYDQPLSNTVWARCCGLGLHEFNQLESSFLARIQYRLFFTEADYDAFLSFLEVSLALQRAAEHPSYPISYGAMAELTRQTPVLVERLFRVPLLHPIQALFVLVQAVAACGLVYVASVAAFYTAFQTLLAVAAATSSVQLVALATAPGAFAAGVAT